MISIQGCCVSTPSIISPYPTDQGANPSSRTAITSTQQQSQAAIQRPSTHASSHSNRHHHVPLAKHINKPLKLHVWRSEPRIWTRKELDRERIAFFDTRVTGRPEIWQTIQQVLDVLWSGGDEGDTDGGLATAQTILDAAGITIPTGDLAGGAYDSFGAHYSLPEYIVSDPQDLAEVPAGNSNQGEDKSCEEGEDSLSEDELLRRRQEKGKGVLNDEDMITIRVKVSDREETPLRVTISREDKLKTVAFKILEEAEVRVLSHPRGPKLIGGTASIGEEDQDCLHGQNPGYERDFAIPGMAGGACCKCMGVLMNEVMAE